MRTFLARLFGSRAVFPRWFHDIVRGDMKVVIGQDLSRLGEPEIVLKFFRREKFGAWKATGNFPYLEVGHLKAMLAECDRYMQQLTLGR